MWCGLRRETETMTQFWLELARTAHQHGHEYDDLALCPDELPDRYIQRCKSRES
jgi:hypothetical protein